MTSEDVKEEVFQSADFNDSEEDEEKEKEDSLAEIPSNDVIEERIVPSKSFQIYGGKIFDPTSTNSNSSQIKPLPEQVYDTTQKSQSNFESPLQKFRRLKYEINEFQTELEAIVEHANKEEIDPSKELSQQLSKDLNNLFSSVEDFKSNPHLAQLFLDSNKTMLDTVDPQYLFKKLASFQAEKQANSNSNSDDNSSRAVFTLYHDGTVNKQSYRVQELESRLAQMETVLGPAPKAPIVGSMMRTVEYLTKRMELLADNSKLYSLERRAEVLRKKLQEITAKAHSTIELQITKTKEEKINKLFDMMVRWDESAIQLPTVIRRLQSVANLHEESANVVNKVEQLDVQARLIKSTLENNSNTLSKLHSNLAENNQIVMSNLQSIQERVQNLQQKINQMK